MISIKKKFRNIIFKWLDIDEPFGSFMVFNTFFLDDSIRGNVTFMGNDSLNNFETVLPLIHSDKLLLFLVH